MPGLSGIEVIRRLSEKLLRKTIENLERTIADRTAELKTKTVNLEELNVALNVLLKKREDDKRDKTSKEIAKAFHVSESAIIHHRHNIREKLDLNKKKGTSG